MKTKISALLLGLLVLPLAGLAAQTQDNSFSILSFDIGYAPTYILDDSGGGDQFQNLSTFALNAKITDRLIVGFGTYTGDFNLSTFTLKYQITERVRLGLSLGSTDNVGDVVSGIGFEIIPFSRKVQNAVATEFKLTAQYLFVPSGTNGIDGTGAPGIDKGALFFGLAVGLGF